MLKLLKLLMNKIKGAGVSSSRFDGKDFYQPGYAAKRNISALDIASATGSTLLLIGECKGGIPYNASADYPDINDRINWVSKTEELDDNLRDGKAYYGALFALTPSNQAGINGAPVIGVIRVNQATRSSLTVKDIDGGDVVDIKSLPYGLYTNQLRIQISAGTTAGRKISVKFEDKTIEEDNITNEVISVQYIGTGTNCDMTLDPAGDLVTTVTAGAAGDDIAGVDMTSMANASNLVAYFNAYQNTGGVNVYSATLLGDENFDLTTLDMIIGGDLVDIKTAYTIKAILQECIDWVNDSSEYLIAVLNAGADRRPPAIMAGYSYLTGGSEGAAVITSDYTNALADIAALMDASFVGVMTSDAAVHAVLNSHLTSMCSSTGKKERQGCVGAATGETESQLIARAKVINNLVCGFYGSDIKRYDKNGVLQTWDSYYGACQILGMMAGNGITFSPTNKMINAVSVTKIYSSTSLDNLIKGGVMVSQPSDMGGIRVVRAITTYQGSNIIANEMSAVRTILYITKDHRAYVQQLVGEPGDTTILESIKNRGLLRLDYYVDQGWLVVDPALGNAYRNVVFTTTADTVKFDYEGTIPLPVNFIFATHNFVVVGSR